jgi:uncharacterized protein (DUF1697 family)
MPAYAALLRGINIGPNKRVAMADLRRLVEGIGGEEVETYVQSGNAVFRSSARSGAKLEQALHRALADDLGLDVEVLVRSAAELARLVDGNPFAADEDDPKKLHVTFLAEKPATAKVRALLDEAAGSERAEVTGRDIYLHFPDGYGRAVLTNPLVERRLGVVATTRNWRTVLALRDLTAARA